jgi:hypothetical protein
LHENVFAQLPCEFSPQRTVPRKFSSWHSKRASCSLHNRVVGRHVDAEYYGRTQYALSAYQAYLQASTFTHIGQLGYESVQRKVDVLHGGARNGNDITEAQLHRRAAPV